MGWRQRHRVSRVWCLSIKPVPLLFKRSFFSNYPLIPHVMNSGKPRSPIQSCAGPLDRRSFMQLGLAGFASLSLPGIFRARAMAAAFAGSGKPSPARTAVIMSIRTTQSRTLAANIEVRLRPLPRRFPVLASRNFFHFRPGSLTSLRSCVQ